MLKLVQNGLTQYNLKRGKKAIISWTYLRMTISWLNPQIPDMEYLINVPFGTILWVGSLPIVRRVAYL
jgi:hypothetical protein